MDELIVNIQEPNEKQKLFLADTHKYVAFGGARGGGKSWAVRTKAKLLAFAHPGIKQLIIRKTYPELKENHIKPLIESLPLGSYSYNDGKKELRFPNGSEILFGYCNNERDIERYQGTEVDILYIDEATQLPEEQFRKLSACVRGVNSFPKRVYLTCNPGGIGHGWVKRLFISRNFNEDERAEDYSFIQSLVTDNKILCDTNPDYIAQLQALNPKLRKAWLEGDWDIFEGQFFEEFRDDPAHYHDRRFTHVIEPFDIPASWNIYRSYDFGYGKPFSCAWWAVDHEGIFYRILELYGWNGMPNEGCKWTPDRQFAEIARIEREHPWLRGKQIYGVADPSIWDSSRGDAIIDSADRNNVYFTKGDNKRIPGWMQCHYRLAFDENGFSMMYVFKGCQAFIRTIPLLQYSTTNPEDLDTDGEDHVADEFRYFAMSRPIAPRRTVVKEIKLNDPAQMAKHALNLT